jgi:LuxR family transcriptional regulator, maltose regulon positive regulatory protein
MKISNLFRTKFLVPRPASGRLARPHLLHWIDAQAQRRLVLISAPPGYGKTTLLADYLASSDRPAAWYQLDPADSDPVNFLTSLIESLRQMSGLLEQARSEIGRAARSLLENAAAGLDAQRIITVLVNELSEQITQPWLVVMDDYHYITSPIVHQMLALLLENASPDLQVILSTRADPPLPLARLRARGQLAELRAAELRFRDDEIAAWTELEIPGLSPDSLALLNEKTEGWAAALQIVRSSLAGQDPRAARQAIAALSGSHRFIFEYLAEEVLRRQPADIRGFLERIAVLDQIDAAACSAVTGRSDAQEILEQLEGENLFVTSLDAQRCWFRFHFLFREFLLSRIQIGQGETEPVEELEKAAGRYYAGQGEWEAAFRHYLQAGDLEAAAQAAEMFAAGMVERGQVEVLHRFLSALPLPTLRVHPELLLQQGNAHHRLGQAGLAMNAYEEARSSFAQLNDSSGASRALTRLAEANRSQGRYNLAEALASDALENAPPDDHAARAEALMALAKSQGFLTNMTLGRSLAEQAVEEARLAGDQFSPLARAAFLQSLGQICWWHGDPHATVRYCEEALQLSSDERSPLAAQTYLLLVTPHLYWREFDTAMQYAERGLEIAQTLQLKELLPAAYTALGNVLTRTGKTARAEVSLRQSLELAQHLGLASYDQLMATGYLAYNLYSQGRVDEAWQLAEGALWSYTGSPDTYEAYVCRSVLADVALESNRFNRAEALYTELLEIGERRQFRIPLALVYLGLAYIHLVTGRKDSGTEYAVKALELIEPTREFQLFVDQGERSRVVCRALQEAGFSSHFLERVLSHLPVKSRLQTAGLADDTAVMVKCLGSFRVYAGGEEISQERWVSTKARDLLAYFVTFRNERIPSERVFDAIWADKAGRGLTAFHTALSRLRSALRCGDSNLRFILAETGEYRLDGTRFNIDVDLFDSALKKARAAPGEEAAAPWYEQAIALYQGEYLQNLYYDWLFPERRRLNSDYLGALRELGDYHYNQKRYTQALELLQRALRVDNLMEDLHCQAMRVYAGLGDRAGLARQYQELAEVLKSELDMEPLESTSSLYRRLVRQVS